MRVEPQHKYLQYSGRIDWSDRTAPVLVFPCTSVRIRFTGKLEHDPAWDQSIDEVCRGMEDEKIRHFMFRRNGRGTPGHLRIPEAEEMAEELSAYIENLEIQW